MKRLLYCLMICCLIIVAPIKVKAESKGEIQNLLIQTLYGGKGVEYHTILMDIKQHPGDMRE
ncbi:MAG: hypothetical protein MRZ45_00460 [Blautia sp.]|nr:hypothetical protein [Blautia sp.]